MIFPDCDMNAWAICDSSVVLANADWYYTKQQTEELIDSVSGMSADEVQTMINRSIHSKADKSYVDEQDSGLSNDIRAINAQLTQIYKKSDVNNLLDLKLDKSSFNTYSSNTANVLDGKVNTSTYNTYTAITNAVLSNKQDKLVSGTNIKTINGESILGSGDLVVRSEGDVTSGEVQTMIDEAVSGKQDTLIAGDNITIVNNVISSTASGDVTSAQVETMIATSISGKADTTAVTQDIATATADMATQTWVQNQGYLTEHQSLSAYSTTDEMNQAISAATDDMATETWVGNQGYITGVDLSNYATLQDIPTSNSALTNDAGYITSAALNGYATEDYVTAATDDMATQTWVNQQGFLTEHQSLSAYSTTQEMNEAINASTSGKADTTAVTQDIATATADMATKTWVGEQGYLTEHQSLSAYSTTQEMNEAISASTSGKVDTSTYTAYTAATDTALQGKQDTLISGTNIKTINNVSILGSGNVDIQGTGNPTIELTQAQYDALVSAGTVSADTFYIITDATAGDLSNYYTKSETSGATQISTALNAKADTATTYTKTEVDNAITAATSTKQDTLVSGTNIKTINNESILGSGNITIQGGGGKAISAGTNISVTTGETADTINCTLPIGMASGYKSIKSDRASVSGDRNIAWGLNAYVGALGSSYTPDDAFAFGGNVKVYNSNEASFGRYNASVQNTHSGGESGTTLFSVGNGTADNARHNAFEIRQNGDIYCSDGTNDVKLQDYIQFKIAKLSQSEYDALVQAGTIDANTVYFITNSNS